MEKTIILNKDSWVEDDIKFIQKVDFNCKSTDKLQMKYFNKELPFNPDKNYYRDDEVIKYNSRDNFVKDGYLQFTSTHIPQNDVYVLVGD